MRNQSNESQQQRQKIAMMKENQVSQKSTLVSGIILYQTAKIVGCLILVQLLHEMSINRRDSMHSDCLTLVHNAHPDRANRLIGLIF